MSVDRLGPPPPPKGEPSVPDPEKTEESAAEDERSQSREIVLALKREFFPEFLLRTSETQDCHNRITEAIMNRSQREVEKAVLEYLLHGIDRLIGRDAWFAGMKEGHYLIEKDQVEPLDEVQRLLTNHDIILFSQVQHLGEIDWDLWEEILLPPPPPPAETVWSEEERANTEQFIAEMRELMTEADGFDEGTKDRLAAFVTAHKGPWTKKDGVKKIGMFDGRVRITSERTQNWIDVQSDEQKEVNMQQFIAEKIMPLSEADGFDEATKQKIIEYVMTHDGAWKSQIAQISVVGGLVKFHYGNGGFFSIKLDE